MRLLIVRHCDPDYEHNTITEQGFIERDALTERLLNEKIDYIYVSPLGRAQKTIEKYLDITKREYQTLDWLKEFPYRYHDEENNIHQGAWDFLPEYFTSQEHFYDNSYWKESKNLKNSEISNGYDYVISKFDDLLLKHGYKRNGLFYETVKENHDTILFVCHMGIEAVLLSRLVNIPYLVLAQHFAALPSSVTTIYTEERREGITQFRVSAYGDLSHLYKNNIDPSFACRFRECASDNTRKD